MFFLDLLYDFVLNSDKIIIVNNFNIHVDAENNSLNRALI